MFTKTKLSTSLEIDSVYTLHYFDYAKDFSFEGETHDFWELVFIDSGNVTVTAEERTFDLAAGDMIFHCPGEFHSIKANGSYAGVAIITFSTSSESAKLLRKQRLKINDEQKLYISLILKETAKAFAGPLDIVDQKALIRLTDAPFGAEQMIKTALEQLLISIIRTVTENKNKLGDKSENYPKDSVMITRIQKILEDNIYGQISLNKISEELNFSKSYLKSRFKAATGYSIYQTFIQMKISLAKKLLSEGKHSVSEISDMLSFSSIHHFSKTFHQYVGMPPMAYSRSVKGRSLL